MQRKCGRGMTEDEGGRRWRIENKRKIKPNNVSLPSLNFAGGRIKGGSFLLVCFCSGILDLAFVVSVLFANGLSN